MSVDVYTYYESRVSPRGAKPVDLSAPAAEDVPSEAVALLLLQALYGTGVLAALALFFTRSPFVALLMGAVGALVGPVVADLVRSLLRLRPRTLSAPRIRTSSRPG